MPITLSEVHRPLFVATAWGVVTDDEYEAYLRQCDLAFFSRTAPYALIYDGSAAEALGPHARELQNAWLNRRRHEVRTSCQGVAFVLANALQRGLLAAAHLVCSPFYPYRIFSGRTEAEAWARAQLSEVARDPGSSRRHSGSHAATRPTLRLSLSAGTSTAPPATPSGIAADAPSSSGRSSPGAAPSVPEGWNSLHPVRPAAHPGSYSLQAREPQLLRKTGLPEVRSAATTAESRTSSPSPRATRPREGRAGRAEGQVKPRRARSSDSRDE